MTNRMQDTVLGISLLLVAGLWSWLAFTTIPGGTGIEVGARAFPLTFGLMLLALSGLLLFRARSGPEEPADSLEENPGANDLHRWITLLTVVAELVAYGMLLKYCGFVIATPILILFILLVNLHERSVRKIALMTVGIPLCCWLIFEKLLGIYLATGTWINLG